MKIGFISDPHFHPFKQHSTIMEDGRNSRLYDIQQAFRAAVDGCYLIGCELFCIAGDIFNVRGQMKPSVYNVVVAELEYAAEKFPVVIIPGNHDMEDFKGGPTAVDALRTIPNVYVAGSVSTLAIRGVRIGLFPYQHTLEGFAVKFAELVEDMDGCDFFMCHQGIDDLAPKGVPASGFSVKKMQEYFGTEKPVFCGHYHKPGIRENVVQLGSPVQHNFGDEGQERGFWTYDNEPGIPLHERIRFHALEGFPLFVTVTTVEEAKKAPKGCFLRVKAGSAIEAKKISKAAKDAKDVTAIVQKTFETVHKEEITVGPVHDMLARYLEITGKTKKERAALLGIYTEVCT